MSDGKRYSGTSVALLLIDVINHFDSRIDRRSFAGRRRWVRNVVMLKQRARAAGIPAIRINDNLGDWKSDGRGQRQRRCKQSRQSSEHSSL
jgi:nicotinamidase-related amidase